MSITAMRTTKLYRTIERGSLDAIFEDLKEMYCKGEPVNVRDAETGETFLHHVVNHAHRYSDPRGVSLLYLLGCKPIDINAQDIHGETALHKVVRRPGAYRIMVALIRCGADPEMKNNDNKTPEDILLTEKPEGYQEMLHWFRKFKPGLWRAIMAPEPDKRLVERLLRSWCRVTVFKEGKVVNMKFIMHSHPHQLDIVYLLEKYENTIEFALAMLSGKAFIVRQWQQSGMMKNIDVNTRDYSYQYRYPDYPEVPQPLLAAVWETENPEIVDLMMELHPDTEIQYSNQPKPADSAMPLFFHVVSGTPRPSDERIVHRILRESDMNARGRQGQTVLCQAIATDKSEAFVKLLFSYGINVASRARCGRTARDLAEAMYKKMKYVKMIDDHVLDIVRECNIERLESLILQSYDHILDIKDQNGKTAMELARLSSSKQLVEVLKNVHNTQDHAKKIFIAIARGNMKLVRKLLTRKFACAQDKCGRTVLHHAFLNKHADIVRHIVNEFPQVINTTDNLGRTPLHYAHLFLDQEEIINKLIQAGARAQAKDVKGWTPREYSLASSGQRAFSLRQREVMDYDLELFLGETNFKNSFTQAVKTGDMGTVKNLVVGLKEHGAEKRFSNLLFLAVDHGQQKIAKYLILSGFSPNVFKQYESCNPDDPMCAMMECSHTVTSFRQRASRVGAKDIVKLLDDIDSGKVQVPAVNTPVDVNYFCQFGWV